MFEISLPTWIITILISMGIPSAITGFIVNKINNKIIRQEERREQ